MNPIPWQVGWKILTVIRVAPVRRTVPDHYCCKTSALSGNTETVSGLRVSPTTNIQTKGGLFSKRNVSGTSKRQICQEAHMEKWFADVGDISMQDFNAWETLHGLWGSNLLAEHKVTELAKINIPIPLIPSSRFKEDGDDAVEESCFRLLGNDYS